MKNYKDKTGFTLIEILIVIGLITVLAAMTITAGEAIINNSKKKQTENTIAILVNALEEYRNYGYQYPNTKYAKLIFPVDCTDFAISDIQSCINDSLLIVRPLLSAQEYSRCKAIIKATNYNPEYSGCGVMYFFLSKVSASRKLLEKIDPSLVTCKDVDKKDMSITLYQMPLPFFRVVDSWGTSLRYDYYKYELNYYLTGNAFGNMVETKRNFPLIRSAGPDGHFDTPDDITSR